MSPRDQGKTFLAMGKSRGGEGKIGLGNGKLEEARARCHG